MKNLFPRYHSVATVFNCGVPECGGPDYDGTECCASKRGKTECRIPKYILYPNTVPKYRCPNATEINSAETNAVKPIRADTGQGVPLQADITVASMMKKDQDRFPERREELLNLLSVDPHWRMHQVTFLPLCFTCPVPLHNASIVFTT